MFKMMLLLVQLYLLLVFRLAILAYGLLSRTSRFESEFEVRGRFPLPCDRCIAGLCECINYGENKCLSDS